MLRPERVCIDCGVALKRNRDHCRAHVLFPCRRNLSLQRRIQGEMAATGYDEAKIRTLITTNWIRTTAHLLLAILAVMILLRVLKAD